MTGSPITIATISQDLFPQGRRINSPIWLLRAELGGTGQGTLVTQQAISSVLCKCHMLTSNPSAGTSHSTDRAWHGRTSCGCPQSHCLHPTTLERDQCSLKSVL